MGKSHLHNIGLKRQIREQYVQSSTTYANLKKEQYCILFMHTYAYNKRMRIQTKRIQPKLRSDYLWRGREVNGIKEGARDF